MEVKYDFTRKAFAVNGQLVSGLLPTLKSTLWPTYSYSRASHVSAGHIARATSVSPQQVSRTAGGVRLDKQVISTVKLLTTYNYSLEVCFNAAARQRLCRSHQRQL